MTPRLKTKIGLLLFSLCWMACSDMKERSLNPLSSAIQVGALPDTTSSSSARSLIKTATINLQVAKVEESVQQFQDLVQRVNGHVYHYEIQNLKYDTKEVEQTLDSTMQLSETHPSGLLKVRVPVQAGDSFVSAVLKMNGSIENFLFDEEDVTEDITGKKELMMSDAQITNSTSGKQTNGNPFVFKELNDSFIQRKSEFAKMNYRTKHVWFDIHLKGRPYISREMVATARIDRVPFYVRAAHAFSDGFYGFSVLLTMLLRLWPFMLIAAILCFIFYRKKYLRPTTNP